MNQKDFNIPVYDNSFQLLSTIVKNSAVIDTDMLFTGSNDFLPIQVALACMRNVIGLSQLGRMAAYDGVTLPTT